MKASLSHGKEGAARDLGPPWGLVRVWCRRGRVARIELAAWGGEGAGGQGLALDCLEQIQEYLRGRRRTFSLPLDLRGTPFQRAVWAEIVAIGWGGSASYGEIAARLGNPRLARAVGQAAGANPLPILIPCHRVLGAGGRLGGFSLGLDIKRALLDLEGIAHVPD